MKLNPFKSKTNGSSLYESAGILSRLTFQWMHSLIMTGQKRPLTVDDLPQIPASDDSSSLAKQLHSAWSNELQTPKPSLWRALYKVYGRMFILTAFLGLMNTVMKVVESLCLGLIIRHFQNDDAPLSDGLWYSAGLFGSVLVHGVVYHQMFWVGLRCGLQIKTGLIGLIYKKALSLTSASSLSSGAVVNLISNDTQPFEPVIAYIHYVWLGPIETIAIGAMLYWFIGPASLVGLSAFLIYLPLQYWFSRRFMSTRKQTSYNRDNRIGMLADVLMGINLVKLSSWEESMKKVISILRGKELKSLRRAAVMKATNEGMYFSFSCIVSTIAFTSYWAINNGIGPEQVFVSLSLFNAIRSGMATFFPKGIEAISEIRISTNRISEYLNLSESTRAVVNVNFDGLNLNNVTAISIDQAGFMWTSPTVQSKLTDIPNSIENDNVSLKERSALVLNNITLDLKKGELLAVAGPVGSGKTSLCMALLGELYTHTGTITHYDNSSGSKLQLSYASQVPWLMAGTIRDNVTFGLDYDKDRFQRVAHACSLDIDLKGFPHHDLTIIGERGVNMSGGQRARIGLARALYRDVDVYILDDPLSAVDPKVGRHLFHHAIQNFLKDKTVVLVSHQLQFISECDRVIVLDNGQIQCLGKVGEVMQLESESTSFLRVLQEFAIDPSKDDLEKQLSVVPKEECIESEEIKAFSSDSAPAPVGLEARLEGKTSRQVYLEFFKHSGSIWSVLLVGFFFFLCQAALISADYFLSIWSNMTHDQQMNHINPIIYGSLTLFLLCIALVRGYYYFHVMLSASGSLFESMLGSVLLSPITFFHTNTQGQILNRFSKDQTQVDEQLPMNLLDTTQIAFMILGCIIIVCVNNPWMLLCIPVIVLAFWYLRSLYVCSSREIKRIDAITRSPIYSYLSETLEGLTSIRAFASEDAFFEHFLSLQSLNTRACFVFMGTSRWLGFRLDMLSALFLAATTFSSVLSRSSQNASQVGLSLNYVLQLTGLVQWAIRQSIEVEMAFVAVERMIEYSKLVPEPPKITSVRPPSEWPSQGKVEIKGLNLAYPGHSAVLKDISLSIKPHEKIGVVGRTGAGKSSLVTALFRLIETYPAGCISIDDVNISEIGLGDLRENLAIIPQEPFLFRGTVRFNLDPLGKYTDQEIWDAITASELFDLIQSIPGKLDGQVSNNGDNFSVGERQLLSLCRAILRQPKLLVMDEATANIDLGTDRLIQSAVQTHFRQTTVLTIAHRLHTVIGDYDRILVLDQGQVVEFDHAWTLLQDSSSLLSNMVQQTGPESERELRIAAQAQFQKLHQLRP